jgi:hypothetical protein
MKIKIYHKKSWLNYAIWSLVVLVGAYILYVNKGWLSISFAVIAIGVSIWAMYTTYKKEYETQEVNCEKFEVIEN